MIPHEFPPWKTVYNYYRAWIANAVWDEIVACLRSDVREQNGRNDQPRVAAEATSPAPTAVAPP